LPEASHRNTRWYALALTVLVADQLGKWIASSQLSYGMPERIFSWFNLTLHHNQGAAFSFLAGAGGWQRWFFTGLAVLVSTAIVFWLRELKARQWPLALALAMVLGGALGNLVDRVRLGYVVDFISVHYRDWYFPTFNIADAAISVGAALIILDSLRASSRDASESSSA
jgi:signal peptidase II